MPEDTITSQETEEELQSQDLRAELLQDLTARFTTALNSNDSIPVVAREALIKLLDSDSPTAMGIINAVSKNDPGEEEVEDE